MKIGLVSPYNIYAPGGVQEALKAYCKEFESRGYDISIISPRPRKIDSPIDEKVHLIGQSKKLNTPFHTTVDVGVVTNLKEIDKLLEAEKFDILHFHEPWVPMMPSQVLSKSKAVNIGTLHAKLPDSIFSKSVEKAITPFAKSTIKRLNYICAVSEMAGDYAHTITSKKIELIPNGIDLEYYNPSSIKNSRNSTAKTVLFIGRLEKRKGVINLLKAYKELNKTHPEIRLVIAGDGPKRKMLEQYSAKNKLSKVEFVGRVSSSEKLELLKQADLFCSPAIFGESFGIVLLEAMAMGVVVVAGDNPGYRTVLKERGQISLVDSQDTAAFTQKLELLLYDDNLRKVWLEWSSEYIKQFNYKKLADRYETIYKEQLLKHAKK